MPVYLAHISEDGREQTLDAHLNGTAERCAQFASAFGAEQAGRFTGTVHDIGKATTGFQARLHGGKKVDHATAGALECVKQNAWQIACCVAGHHGGLPDVGNPRTDQPGDPTLFGRLKKGIGNRISTGWRGTLPILPPPGFANDPLAGSFWIRMLYSCLVDADYLDTEAFQSNDNAERGGYDPLPVLWERLEQYVSAWQNPASEINRRRCEILRACIDGGTREKGLYTLSVPTGGGKTVSSLSFALRHAVHHGMQRIVYVIPYTSIIEQTASVFREILGDENVLEHHSGALFDPEDCVSVSARRHANAAENWDAPVIVTTAVQFFESVYASRPSKCRKLHNLANSVIIFDEAQLLPTAHLRPCTAAIACLTAHFGATAVLCTATQPALSDLLRQYAPFQETQELCPGTDTLYRQFRRVMFREAGKLSRRALADALSELPEVLCIVNTRKAAGELFNMLPPEGSFHLSTLMYPAHRQAVLETVRLRILRGLPCRVVSTSLIEAGVDVDFPAVYREKAGLDSILQAAGRCNRNGKRPVEESIVTIFEGEDAPPPLFRMNIRATNEALKGDADPAEPETIARYFAAFRSLAGDGIDKNGVVRAFERGIAGCIMPFRTVAEQFHMIDANTKTIYVPLGKGEEPIRSLQAGLHSRNLYRLAGRYAVSVYEQHYNALLSAGDIEPLDENSAVLCNLDLYDENGAGLSLDADSGKALFI